ncbi:DUF3592 domain-containing protein [Pseudomonas sp. X10]
MKISSVLKYLFVFVGLAILMAGYSSYQRTKSFLSDALASQGHVIDLLSTQGSDSTAYKAIVQFETGAGQTFELISSVATNPPLYTVGEVVEILYSPTNPDEARIDSFFEVWGAATILGPIGGSFVLAGSLIILFGKWKVRRNTHLIRTGAVVEAGFQGVEVNRRVSINGRHPYQIVCRWLNPATSELHIFQSDNLWFDPSDFIDGGKLRVYVKRGNPRQYHVDLSFLPKIAK